MKKLTVTTLAIIGLALPVLVAPLLGCGPSATYEAGIPPDRARGFMFYAEAAARRMGYGTYEGDGTLTVEAPPDGSIYYRVDPDDGVIVTLRPESEPESEVDARTQRLRTTSDKIIDEARAEAKKNEGF